MRVAVISDIHANFTALEAVMKDIQNEGCEQVFCLGDLILAGPQPRVTIDFIKKQKWTIIQGNTDKIIADFGPEVLEQLKEKFPVMAHALVDDMVFVEQERREYLKELPPELIFEVEGVKVHLVHGSPRRNNEDIMPNMPLSEIEEIISDTDADLILCGHTHVPCGYQTGKGQTVVNVGSVGRPMTATPFACYVIIDFENGTFNIKHKFVDYDRETAADVMRARGFEGSEKLAELLLNPEVRHI